MAAAKGGLGNQRDSGGPTHGGRQGWSREVAGTHVEPVAAGSRASTGRGGGSWESELLQRPCRQACVWIRGAGGEKTGTVKEGSRV